MAKIEQEKIVTIPELVSEANKIWAKCQSARKCNGLSNEMDDKFTNDLMKRMHTEHPDFTKAYPIVIRYMAQFAMYHAEALKLYLYKVKHHPWKTDVDFIESQADYATLLYTKLNPRSSTADIANVRKNIREMLMNEHLEYKKSLKEISAEIEAREKQYGQMNVESLRKFIAQHGEETRHVPVRIKTDEPITEITEPEITLDTAMVESVKTEAGMTASDFL